MRDYTKTPGYEHMTNLQARHNYLHSLLREYQGELNRTDLSKPICPRQHPTLRCETCLFHKLLGGGADICCEWRAEENPDNAIAILEQLVPRVMTHGEYIMKFQGVSEEYARLRKIADHHGIESQMDVLQEECGELIQAVSKLRRAKGQERIAAARDKVDEEMADVYVMLNQIVYLLGNKDTVTRIYGEKLRREENRIADERTNRNEERPRP